MKSQFASNADLIQETERVLARQRRRAAIFTVLPVVGAIVFVIVISTQVARLESEKNSLALQAATLEQKAAEAQARQAELTSALNDAGRQLTELIRATTEIEDLIESEQSYLRSVDEARFLIVSEGASTPFTPP